MPQWQRFQQDSKNALNIYQRQYSHVYHPRLLALSQQCWENVPLNDNDIKRVSRILELAEDKNAIVRVAGTVVVVDREFFLEDESGRVSLTMKQEEESRSFLVTGIVAVVEGYVHEGALHVEQLYFATPKAAPALVKQSDAGQSSSILFLSGLEFGNPDVSSIPRELLLCFIQGRFRQQAKKAAAISHIIIAGGVLHPISEPNDITSTVHSLRDLEAWLLRIKIPVHIMPGARDPTTANWPQRPMHSSALFPHLPPKVFRTVPNPYASQIQETQLQMIGTNGEQIKDLVEQHDQKISYLDALGKTLEWGHLCPNGPDRIPMVPLNEEDPMVFPNHVAPHVLFAAAPAFATEVVRNTRLLCVPHFATTGEAVLLHTDSLGVETLKFQAD